MQAISLNELTCKYAKYASTISSIVPALLPIKLIKHNGFASLLKKKNGGLTHYEDEETHKGQKAKESCNEERIQKNRKAPLVMITLLKRIKLE